MLTASSLLPLTGAERETYDEVVPEDYFWRRLLTVVDFEEFRPVLEAAYTGFGRPPVDCLVLLKLELLARHHRYSDREVIAATRFNVAYRQFLGLSLHSPLPHHTLLTYFRQRQGPERLQQVFDRLVGRARRLGLVKDRLRLKDATHVIANVAVPSTLRLIAEVRDQVLASVRPFAAERVAAEEAQAEALRLASGDAPDAERLVERVTHLRAVLAWADAVPEQAAFAQAGAAAQARVRASLALAHQVLADRDDPDAGDQVVSVHDPDARCGKHGDFFQGYLLDVAMDADSQLLTALNVLPGNAHDALDAAPLIAQEERAHGNDVAAVSLDGAGYRGDVLRTLTDPQGLNLEVFVPPTVRPPTAGVFAPDDFTLSPEGQTLTCPAGRTTDRQLRHDRAAGRRFRFSQAQCQGCPLKPQCWENPGGRVRSVFKSDYETEYRAAQAQAQTPAYAQIRREHPAIERKLAELVRRHDLRHARYRGRARVLVQSLVTGLVVNMKRMVRLVAALAEPGGGTVRAAVGAMG